MAALVGLLAKRAVTVISSQSPLVSIAANRCLSTSSVDHQETEGWFKNLLVRKIDTGKESHSTQLADKDMVYEMQIHCVKPEFMDTYLKQFEVFNQMMQEKKTRGELAGSWTVEVGDQDEAIHLWKYPGGYLTLNEANRIYRTDKDFVEFRETRNKMLRSRRNQILLAFSFWPQIEPKDGRHIYELRSYTLKPGTMIEWGNHWVHGLKHRREHDEAVAGLFTQIGQQYVVHHFWAYESLQARKDIREAAWRRPGWDECVAYTVPLIRHMQARILIPTPFSPVQ